MRWFAPVPLALLVACAGSPPSNLVGPDGRLAACPASPNCVSSEALDAEHSVAPLQFAGQPALAWEAARAAVLELPRTTIVTLTEDRLHAESRSRMLGFVDDLELVLHAQEGSIAVRSAARSGYSDMGVNRRRIDALRVLFDAHGGPVPD